MHTNRSSGWRGITLIAIVYFYFLIFAQFAFLARLTLLGIVANNLKIVMAAMACGGILLSLFGARIRANSDPTTRLRFGLAVCAVSALLSLTPLTTVGAAIIAFLIGSGLGISTVTLVTHLDLWIGERRPLLKIGIATGLAYAICNVPLIFTGAPATQALLAAASCVIGIALPWKTPPGTSSDVQETTSAPKPFLLALLSFFALIWLDSAAFYIIQHTEGLKAGTWMGSVHLWINAALHFGGAIFAAFLLERQRTQITLAFAVGAIGFACLLLQSPNLVLSASLFYPLGVSLYSVTLIAYPAFLSKVHSRPKRAQMAGFLYAIAGWVGSALGIGMGQNLGHVPIIFVAAATLAVLLPSVVLIIKTYPREMSLVSAGALAAILIYRSLPAQPVAQALTAAERGRQVYISEGCINCHSQYVRPNSPDIQMWGPTEDLEQIHLQRPPLIGNRRQGPDLSEVGVRRSPLWLKEHLINPRELSFHSPMPSYAILFQSQRGEDLVAYLAGLQSVGSEKQIVRESTWQPEPAVWNSASASEGHEVYVRHCATCHDSDGAARNQLEKFWPRMPLDTAALRAFAQTQPAAKLAQISKFGIPATEMPGHEYLNERQLASLAVWLQTPPAVGSKPESPERTFP